MLAQVPVQAVGELLPVGLAEGGRAARVDAAAAQFFHEGAHRQLLGDIVLRVELAARIERKTALGQHVGGQRDVARDDQVARDSAGARFPGRPRRRRTALARCG